MARARPTIPGALLFVALVVLVPVPGTAYKQPEPSATPTRLPPLLDCGPAPLAPAGASAFRANVLSLLRDIPSAAAAAAAGFATARSGRTGRDRAFARGLCFGGANTSSTAAACRACLSAAARDATDGCGASRRAGVWRAGCFLTYADSEALSAREEEFRGWFYAADPDTTAATLKDRVCAGDRTAPECDQCFGDAARSTAALPWLVRMRGKEVIVVGYSCCLRVQISVLPIARELSYTTTISPSILAESCGRGIGAFSDDSPGSTGYSTLYPSFIDDVCDWRSIGNSDRTVPPGHH